MDLSRLGFATAALPAGVPARRCPVNAMGLLPACRVAWEQGAHLAALWASDERDRERGYTLNVVVQDGDGLVMFEHTLPTESTRPTPTSRSCSPPRTGCSGRRSISSASRRKPMTSGPGSGRRAGPSTAIRSVATSRRSSKWQAGQEEYAFVRVEGDGVHEIPVGPVHAGIIEPGHFRFQIVGEKVLRLEERLGYVHKGIEKQLAFGLLDLALQARRLLLEARDLGGDVDLDVEHQAGVAHDLDGGVGVGQRVHDLASARRARNFR